VLANGVTDRQQELHTVTELVVPAVVVRREKLLDDTHVRPGDVDPVVARVDSVARGAAERLGEFVHRRRREHVRLEVDETRPVGEFQLPRRLRDGCLWRVRVALAVFLVPQPHTPQAALRELDEDA
jgi:hypothetical protein